MALPRPAVSSSLCSLLAAIVGVGLLVASSPAGAANSLPTPPEARFVTSAPPGRLDREVVPAYAEQCERTRRCGEEYVFAATRGLRQPGIDPAVAVLLAPATLVFDAVFFPFALALDSF